MWPGRVLVERRTIVAKENHSLGVDMRSKRIGGGGAQIGVLGTVPKGWGGNALAVVEALAKLLTAEK